MMSLEVQQLVGHLSPFTEWIMIGVVLDLIGGGLIGAAILLGVDFGGEIDLGGLFWAGVVVGSMGLVSTLVGLYYLLQGLFTTMASIVYRPN